MRTFSCTDNECIWSFSLSCLFCHCQPVVFPTSFLTNLFRRERNSPVFLSPFQRGIAPCLPPGESWNSVVLKLTVSLSSYCDRNIIIMQWMRKPKHLEKNQKKKRSKINNAGFLFLFLLRNWLTRVFELLLVW